MRVKPGERLRLGHYAVSWGVAGHLDVYFNDGTSVPRTTDNTRVTVFGLLMAPANPGEPANLVPWHRLAGVAGNPERMDELLK